MFRPRLMNIGDGETVEIPMPVPMRTPKPEKEPEREPYKPGVPIRLPERVPVKVGGGYREPLRTLPDENELPSFCPTCGKRMEEVETEEGENLVACPRGHFSYEVS